jgi:hypothetical protein
MNTSDLNERIRTGYYTIKTEYPKPPKRNSKCSQCNTQLQKDSNYCPNCGLKICNTKNETKQYHEDVKKYHEEEHTLHELFRNDLKEEYGLQNSKYEPLIWEKAWEHGHAHGYYEIQYWYEEFSDIVKK